MCPQTLILGVLGAGHGVSPGEGGVLARITSVVDFIASSLGSTSSISFQEPPLSTSWHVHKDMTLAWPTRTFHRLARVIGLKTGT